MNKDVKTFTNRVLAFVFSTQFILLYPVYSIMFIENGLSKTQVSTLLALWGITSLVLEIPLGVVADRISRKWVLFASALFKTAGFLTWFFWPVYIGYAIGFVLWGISSALKSGTLEAYVYDGLKSFNAEKEFEKVNGRIYSVGSIGVALALIIGGAVSEFGYAYVSVASIIVTVVSILVIGFAGDYEISKSTGETNVWKSFGTSIKRTMNNLGVMRLMVLFVMLMGIYGGLDEFWPILMSGLSWPNWAIGITGFIGYFSYALAGVVNERFPNFSNNFSYRAVAVGTLISYFGFYLTHNYAFFIISYFVGFVASIVEIKMSAQMQDMFESETRATMTSIRGMLIEVIGVSLTLIIGWASDINLWNIMLVPSVVLMGIILFEALSSKSDLGVSKK